MAKIIKLNQTITTSEHSISTFTEYPFNLAGLSLGISEINGRYPASGFDVDAHVDQIWYVLSGSGMVQIADTAYRLSVGDMLQLERGEKYIIDGNLRLIVASSPAWSEDQHQHIE